MARAVGNQRMLMVGWTVSGSDWATNDAGAVARRVLRGVRPGAIVDLHDGLDGNIAAPRRMLIEALPMILDGLASKGLQAVTLDRLLGVEPYRGRC
jgi:peptidoglycan/xylan/chitin deacetylase (PgdA/CDA1 family)